MLVSVIYCFVGEKTRVSAAKYIYTIACDFCYQFIYFLLFQGIL